MWIKILLFMWILYQFSCLIAGFVGAEVWISTIPTQYSSRGVCVDQIVPDRYRTRCYHAGHLVQERRQCAATYLQTAANQLYPYKLQWWGEPIKLILTNYKDEVSQSALSLQITMMRWTNICSKYKFNWLRAYFFFNLFPKSSKSTWSSWQSICINKL